MRNYFNFRHVLDRLGISLLDSKRNQVVGRMLDRWAKLEEIEKIRPLTEKTASKPSVKAPHCICAYPLEHLEDAVLYVKEELENGDDALQGQLDLGIS